MDRTAQLREHLGPSTEVFALRYSPYSPRAFFIVCRDIGKAEIAQQLSGFMNSPWRGFFKSDGNFSLGGIA